MWKKNIHIRLHKKIKKYGKDTRTKLRDTQIWQEYLSGECQKTNFSNKRRALTDFTEKIV